MGQKTQFSSQSKSGNTGLHNTCPILTFHYIFVMFHEQYGMSPGIKARISNALLLFVRFCIVHSQLIKHDACPHILMYCFSDV